MIKLKRFSYSRIILLAGLIVLIFCAKTFAAEVSIKPPITGSYARYEIQLVPTASQSAHKLTPSGSTLKVTVPVVAGNTDIIRNIKVSLAPMKNVDLIYSDRGGILGKRTVGETSLAEETIGTYGDTLYIDVKSPDSASTSAKPIFQIDAIKYEIKAREPSESSADPGKKAQLYNISDLSGNDIVKEAETSLGIKSIVSADKTFYEESKADFLFYETHSSPFGLCFLDKYNSTDIKSLTNKSNLDWIFQNSCSIVNLDNAINWCNYLNKSNESTSTHITKGVLGYSQLTNEYGKPISKFLDLSQKRPLLDSYFGLWGRSYTERKESANTWLLNDTCQDMAYATAIINENNIRDSLYDVSKTTKNSNYRYYQFTRNYYSNPINQSTLYGKDLTIRAANDLEVSYDDKYAYLKTYNVPDFSKPDKKRFIYKLRLPKDGSAVIDKNYCIDKLNSMSVDEFDKYITNDSLFYPGELSYGSLVKIHNRNSESNNNNKTRLNYIYSKLSTDAKKIVDNMDTEQLSNPSFDMDTSGWGLEVGTAAQASGTRNTSVFNSTPASYDVRCINPGNNEGDIKVLLPAVNFVKGDSYTLKFKAKATTPFKLPKIALNKQVIEANSLDFHTEWYVYTYSFRPEEDYTNARITLLLGKEMPANSNLYLDSFSLKRYPSLSGGEIIYNEFNNMITDGGFFKETEFPYSDIQNTNSELKNLIDKKIAGTLTEQKDIERLNKLLLTVSNPDVFEENYIGMDAKMLRTTNPAAYKKFILYYKTCHITLRPVVYEQLDKAGTAKDNNYYKVRYAVLEYNATTKSYQFVKENGSIKWNSDILYGYRIQKEAIN